MLRLLSKLRSKLLSEGRTGRYFAYLLGETLLVMIGILLALQVDDWNDERLARIEEASILRNLKLDFENAVDELTYLNGLRESVINSAEEIVSYVPWTGAAEPPESLVTAFRVTLNSPTFNNQVGSLQVLFSTGKFNLISSDEIKNRLIAWPGQVEDMREEEIYHDQVYRGPYLDGIRRYVSLAQIGQGLGVSGLDFSGTQLGGKDLVVPMQSDYPALMSDREFLNALVLRVLHLRINVSDTNFLLDQAGQIIELIDAELARLQ